ncbi:MAG: hypothetical protein PHQ66_03095 [Candidatus Nanoarchaeia archaeon]|nr:hypothetical protein [Candidatus Nanoarchaeia archaeon]MDD5357647.1 hypothetical protein [Candidatus Nanoarchaeia archaeon]MDD5588566.1 hypothetical protein [Candidatus Nanoarchaeia archaeon]
MSKGLVELAKSQKTDFFYKIANYIEKNIQYKEENKNYGERQ